MNRPLPEVEMVDMRREFQETGQEQLFSRALIEQTQAALDRGEQALILLNRRGYSSAVICRACGAKLECQNCAIALTHHKPPADQAEIAREGQRLECHYCGYRRTVPARCPQCDSEHLYYLGAGSEQGEERLTEIFPTARIGRMDRDTVRGRHDLERLLARLHSGEINLLVGTQMIAKGHDIHGVTLVGVVGCDHALSMPDFRAAERVFQLMTQVSGRAGRGELPGRVVVQTYYPDHYAIVAAGTHDYASFVRKGIEVSALDALSAVRRAGQRAGAGGEAGRCGGMVGGAGQVVSERRAGRYARAGAVHCAGGAHQGDLSVSPDSESGVAEGAECGAAGHDGACRCGRGAAAECDRGCGCAEVDVAAELAELGAGSGSAVQPRDRKKSRGWGTGVLCTGKDSSGSFTAVALGDRWEDTPTLPG